MDSNRLGKQGLELLGMLMIGDGLLTAVQTERHLRLWQGWSPRLDRAMQFFLERTTMTRLLGIAEMGAGLALCSSLSTRAPRLGAFESDRAWEPSSVEAGQPVERQQVEPMMI